MATLHHLNHTALEHWWLRLECGAGQRSWQCICWREDAKTIRWRDRRRLSEAGSHLTVFVEVQCVQWVSSCCLYQATGIGVRVLTPVLNTYLQAHGPIEVASCVAPHVARAAGLVYLWPTIMSKAAESATSVAPPLFSFVFLRLLEIGFPMRPGCVG